MPATKEVIAEALKTIDPTNDALWTEDGAPLIAEVQRITGDDTVTREQINDALPGFARTVKNAADDLSDETTPGATQPAAKSPTVVSDLTVGDTRNILDRRIIAANLALDEARRDLYAAQQKVTQCEQRLQRAHQDHQRKFPPVTASDAIKAHIEAGQRRRTEAALAAERPQGPSQIDIAMGRSGKRGESRPQFFAPAKVA